MKKLDLETLKYTQRVFKLYSDHSTGCLGYKYLCKMIEELEEENKPKDIEIEQAEILMQELSEHRT